MLPSLPLVLLLASMEASTAATGHCLARHLYTGAQVAARPVKGETHGNWGLATYRNGWPHIVLDRKRLDRWPSQVLDFTLAHECAHLQLQSSDENRASCQALIDLRRGGSWSAEDEAELGAVFLSLGSLPETYGNSGEAHWLSARRCADESGPQAAARPPVDSP